MTAVRARINIADALLLMMGVAIALMVVGRIHHPMIIPGAFLAYVLLIAALFVVPRMWFDD